MATFIVIGFLLIIVIIVMNGKIERYRKNSEYQMRMLYEENKKLKKKVKFYEDIDKDSCNFNEDDSDGEKEEIIQTENRVQKAEKSETLDKDSQRSESGAELFLSLDNEQKEAFNKIENSNRNYFITGKAGTGKSFLLKAFVKKTKKKVVMLAPTGIAALNIGGATIHSTFGYFNLTELDTDTITLDTLRLKEELKLVLRIVETIIIDEVSMVRADVFDKIDCILRVLNNNSSLFGGKQILLFGDVFQLSPIADKVEEKYLFKRYGGVHFFDSEAYKSGNFGFIELSVNHRQKDDRAFFDILNRMRTGDMTNDDIQALNRRVVPDANSIGRILSLYPKKADAEKKNEYELKKISGEEYTYKANITYSVEEMNATLEKVFPIKDKLRIKCGAVVMMTVNDPNKSWVNGTIGIVRRLEKERIFVTINGQTREVYRCEFVQQEAVCIDGKIRYRDILRVNQFPIVPAYAITIHKSQGLTFKKIACDISMCFAPGQAYVALSRCSSLEGLNLLKKINVDMIMTNSHVVEFYEKQRINANLDRLLFLGDDEKSNQNIL